MSHQYPNRQELLDMARQFMPSCLLGALAELNVFTLLGDRWLSADELAAELPGDARALRILLDAAAGLRLLDKREGGYCVPPAIRPWLTDDAPETALPMLLHSMNILRNWSRLAWVARSGRPPERQESIRGGEADRAAFVAAMHAISGPVTDDVVARLGPLKFTHLLDVGGASGTWTMAFLRAVPDAKATLFDLPDAVEQARDRISKSPFADRIELVAGDFYTDPLPVGADFVWLSAIAHQHSREHNRRLYAKAHAALVPGGRIAVRDVVMDGGRTGPPQGLLFAVNMLANTESGDTFTFEEFAEDLQAAGFIEPDLVLKSDDMNSVVTARRTAEL